MELTAGQTRGGHRLLTAGAYLVLVLGSFLAGFLLVPRPDGGQSASSGGERVELPRPQPVGDFTLQDVGAPDAAAYTRDRLLGRWTLMYFGYSHCPDVCRPTLEALAQVVRRLRALPGWTAEVEPVFVSLDPARDSPKALRAYLSRAGVDVVGLRGSEKQTATLAARLGLLYTRGDADEAGDYLVDHPATILLIDPTASLRAGFRLPHDAGRIVEQVLQIQATFAGAGNAG